MTVGTRELPAGLLALLDLCGGRDVRIVRAAPPERARVERELRRSGYDVVHALPRGPAEATELVSVDAAALRFARPSRLTAILGAPGISPAVRRVAPGVLLVAARGDSDGNELRALAPFVMRLSPARERGYLYRFGAGGARPSSVTKIALTPEGRTRLAAEGAALRDLAPVALRAGAVVPELVDWNPAGERPVLVESFVSGEPAARILAEQPQSLETIVSALAHWLARWVSATARSVSPAADVVEADVLRPARGLAGVLPAAFGDWVTALAERLTQGSLSTAAAHNDLTMWNVLVGDDGRLAVLDWEAAADTSLPLTDLFYAVVDAVAATTGYRSRVESFRACFHRDGGRLVWARSVVVTAAREARVTDEILRASFVACWLRHAWDEHRRSEAGGFLSLLRELADAPSSFWPLGERAD